MSKLFAWLGCREPQDLDRGVSIHLGQRGVSEEALARAGELPRRSESDRAAWLYAEALARGADAKAVRAGLCSLFFQGSERAVGSLTGLDDGMRRAYADAAGVQMAEPQADKPTRQDVRRYLKSVSLDEPSDDAAGAGTGEARRVLARSLGASTLCQRRRLGGISKSASLRARL